MATLDLIPPYEGRSILLCQKWLAKKAGRRSLEIILFTDQVEYVDKEEEEVE